MHTVQRIPYAPKCACRRCLGSEEWNELTQGHSLWKCRVQISTQTAQILKCSKVDVGIRGYRCHQMSPGAGSCWPEFQDEVLCQGMGNHTGLVQRGTRTNLPTVFFLDTTWKRTGRSRQGDRWLLCRQPGDPPWGRDQGSE